MASVAAHMTEPPREGSGIVERVPEAKTTGTDDDLVARLRRGDSAACRDFYERVRPAIDRALFRVLGRDEEEHEDLVQLALEQTYTSICGGGFRGECSLSTWATTISSRVGLATLRSRYRKRLFFLPSSDPEELESAPRCTGDGEAQLLARAELRQVRKALARMSEKRAEAIILHDVEGLTLKEVARALQVSEAAAHSRVVRGRKQLRDTLSDLEHGT